MFILYDSDNSPLPSGRVQINELAWIGSMLGIGGLAGTVVIGWLTDRIGRKHSLIAMAVPLIVMTAFGMKCSSNFIVYSFQMRTFHISQIDFTNLFWWKF